MVEKIGPVETTVNDIVFTDADFDIVIVEGNDSGMRCSKRSSQRQTDE
jgi:hypothetical protein